MMEAVLEVFMSYFGSHRRFSFEGLQKPVISKGMAVPRGKHTIILKLQVTSKDFRYTYPLQSMQAFPGCIALPEWHQRPWKKPVFRR